MGPTRMLCEEVFETQNYDMRVIIKTYDDGYIKRFGKVSMLIRKSITLVIKAKKLLSRLNNIS
jgi:hypothetical protein